MTIGTSAISVVTVGPITASEYQIRLKPLISTPYSQASDPNGPEAVRDGEVDQGHDPGEGRLAPLRVRERHRDADDVEAGEPEMMSTT